MARVLQIRRGTTAQNDNFTGLPGELSFDTDTKTLRVHDGERLGGYALARADAVATAPGTDDGFDIYSVPDEFWSEKILEFAPSSSFTVLTSRAVPLSATVGIEYVFNTDKTGLFADAVLICDVAEAGYSAGDVVASYGFGAYTATSPIIFYDMSGAHVRMLTGGDTPWVRNRMTGVVTNITADSWKIQFRLYC